MRFGLIVAIVLAGCAPSARPYGVAAGTVLSVIGAALVIDAHRSMCAPDTWEGLGCELDDFAESHVGAALLIGGVATLLAAAMSPGEPTAPSPPAAHSVAPPPLPPPAPPCGRCDEDGPTPW